MARYHLDRHASTDEPFQCLACHVAHDDGPCTDDACDEPHINVFTDAELDEYVDHRIAAHPYD